MNQLKISEYLNKKYKNSHFGDVIEKKRSTDVIIFCHNVKGSDLHKNGKIFKEEIENYKEGDIFLLQETWLNTNNIKAKDKVKSTTKEMINASFSQTSCNGDK